ncbi:hypothetical protein C7974DRAFT_425961 [Boeremia exigua]|uniref:uncharacterized protein n=1 Tax=Boeremia exigua TaxID=749465 RepID=UPI001E8E21A5|nr:uncharacterized protein C7974DRAFT_425961 [Boeremia exigua]KAH6622261.1 hypothetical protein C7974DRAFT_425961 [Boeremia exigua]
MSFPMSQSSLKVPIPRVQSRRHQQPPRRDNQPYRDRVLIACLNCRERKVTDDVTDAAATLRLVKSLDLNDTHGEALISIVVGSNDETNILDEDILKDKDSQATGYIGKSSKVQGLRRLQQDSECWQGTPLTLSSPYGPPGASFENAKQRMEAFKERQQHKPIIPTSTSTFYLDGKGVEVDYNVDPYALPTIKVAQRLLDWYMSTVQDMFPVLAKQIFTDQFRHYFTSATQGTPDCVPKKWLAILNLVFAIGARFSNLTEADWQADS